MLAWYERQLAWLAPRWAAERARARVALQQLRAFDAASTAPRFQNWTTTGTGPNAEVAPSLATLRNRARDLGRNNPYAAHAYGLLPAKIVGRGIVPLLPGRSDGASPRTRSRLQSRWDEWAGACDVERRMSWSRLQRLVARTVIESGECLLKLVVRDETDAPGGIPLALQVMEPDYVDVARTGLYDGEAVVQGVAFAGDGRRAGYWVFDQHPGEVFAAATSRSLRSRRIAAEDVICVFDAARPGQVHGIPWIAPSVVRTKFLADFDAAVLERKRLQACFTAFVTSPAPDLSPLLAEDGQALGLEEIGPGFLKRLAPGEEVSLAAPAPGDTGDAEYQMLQLHAIAAGLGLTYAQLTGDLRQANYSSLRAGTLDFWSLVDGWQDDLIESQLCRPVWRQWAKVAELVGVRAVPLSPRWSRPARPFIDPAKDGEAEDAAIKAGRKTLFESVAERGRDPVDHLDELAEINAALDDRGLVLVNDLRHQATPVPPPATAAPEAPGTNGEAQNADA